MSDVEIVTIVIDGVEVKVPKGTNLIEAAHSAGVEIPHYCYHRHLSIAGNCRMCQVEVEGRPKLEIACNTGAQEGMVVRTQRTSERTADAQRATLEFLLINHPLDCTVCDQAGHCKLQDYYYEYNAKPSRFIEQKRHKVKAEPFGPEVIYDGERCILCTRCVRFCDEVTKTGELGVFNRGVHAVIGIHEGRELNNPLSGCVVDLCPVGALTHRRWRFNTRIWYTAEVDTVCPGCSTGCSAKVAVRDDQIVHVKGRLNTAVNQEWLCDEGRYGFGRFQPASRLHSQFVRDGDYLKELPLEEALNAAAELRSGKGPQSRAVLLSPFLTLEEVWASLAFAEKVMGLAPDSDSIAMQVKQRPLSDVEAVLISPDYAPNARAMNLFGHGIEGEDWRAKLEARYAKVLTKLKHGV
ncbi:MAG: (2Fe-2S)-binding protein, partial [Bdellovibrionales bacterium]|nr:(2Fe-2S)-binding protein [Bdellovibrionales bacterium]